MKKFIYFFLTVVILILLNIGASLLFHASFIDLSILIGFLGLLITMPNNPMTMVFNSKVTISAGEIHGKRPGQEKFGKIPIFASFLYTLVALVATFLLTKSISCSAEYKILIKQTGAIVEHQNCFQERGLS